VIAILRSYYIAKVIFSFKNFGGVYSPRKNPRHYLLMIFPAINLSPQFRFYTQDLSALKSSCRKSPVIAILRSYYNAKVIFSFKNFGGVYSPRKNPRLYLLMIFPALNHSPQFRFHRQDLFALKSSCRKSPVIAILRNYYIAKVIFSFKNFGGVYSPRKNPRRNLLMIFPAINLSPQFRFHTQDFSVLKSSCRKSPVIAILRSYYNTSKRKNKMKKLGFSDRNPT